MLFYLSQKIFQDVINALGTKSSPNKSYQSISGKYTWEIFCQTWYCSTLYIGASPLHEGVSTLEGAEHPKATHSEDAMAPGTDSISSAGQQVCWRGYGSWAYNPTESYQLF